MKTTILTGVIATLTTLLPTTTLAQSEGGDGSDLPQIGPFHLQVQSNDSTVNGRYLSSCHTGAAMQTLCIGSINKPAGPNVYSSLYYLNQTQAENPQDGQMGYLTWNLPLNTGGNTIQNISLPLTLQFNNIGSNVAVTSISVGSAQPQLVGFHNDLLYLPNWYDDSTFEEGVRPNITGEMQQLRHWHACYTLFGSYYYQALAWVTSGDPHNKNCRPVDIVKVAYP